MIRPKLEYGNSFWCPYRENKINILEKNQRQAMFKLANIKIPSFKRRYDKMLAGKYD
jgi:hypothetical protein